MIAIMRSFFSGLVTFTTAPLAFGHTGERDYFGTRRFKAFHLVAAPTTRSYIGPTIVQCDGEKKNDRETDLGSCFHETNAAFRLIIFNSEAASVSFCPLRLADHLSHLAFHLLHHHQTAERIA
jgi:hypothetical protein